MNHGNVCKDINVKKIIAANPIQHMMEAQLLLQTRLGKGHVDSDSFVDIANKVIYWRHCIHSECDELLDWYQDVDADHQELEMEIVDIMHFVFNIAIVTGISAVNIESQLKDYVARHDQGVALTTLSFVEKQICNLSGTITNYIDLLPWKSWKTYDEAHVPELTEIVQAFAAIVQANLELAAFHGMTMERVVSVYCAKNAENHARQDRNY